jgi:hypothetical protein
LRAQSLRVTAVFITFEAMMPLIGFAVGTPLIHLIADPHHIVIDPYQLGSAVGVLLVGPPLVTHAFPHFIHSYFPCRVIPSPAPSGVTIKLPGAAG